MSEQPNPITLEDAGALLGGDKPWSRKTVERVIAAGLLNDYGRGMTRRVLRRDVENLIERLSKGEVAWPPRKATATEAPTNTRKAQADGSRKSPSKAKPFGVVQIRNRPPTRDYANSKN